MGVAVVHGRGFVNSAMQRAGRLRGSSAFSGLRSLLYGSNRLLNTSATERILRRHPIGNIWQWKYVNSTNNRFFTPNLYPSPTALRLPRSYSSSSHERAQHPHSHKHHNHDLYSVLGISPNATQQQIKEQYYSLSMRYHPDRNKGSQKAHQRFSEITEAYSILGQHDLRRKYDKGLLQDYPRKPHTDTHPKRDRHPEAAMSKTGQKKIYDFDEFYRAHYGEALKWQRKRTAERKAAAADAARQQALSEPMHRLLIILVTFSVFVVGWAGAKYREQQQKEGKWA